jgi:hypothetical protein
VRLLQILLDCCRRRRVPRVCVISGTFEMDTEHGRAPIKGGFTVTVAEATRKPAE